MICTHREDTDGETVRERANKWVLKERGKWWRGSCQEWNKSMSGRGREFGTAADFYFLCFWFFERSLWKEWFDYMCVLFGLCLAGVHSEPGLERSQVSAAAVLFDLKNRGQGAWYPAVQVRSQKTAVWNFVYPILGWYIFYTTQATAKSIVWLGNTGLIHPFALDSLFYLFSITWT